MTRAELLQLLTAASLPHPGVEVLVVGSQSVLGAYDADHLPEQATLSMEADVLLLRDGHFDQELTDVVDAVFGEGSAFHEQYGFYAQGVDEHTSVLPQGWQARLVLLGQVPRPTSVPGAPATAGGIPVRCLDPHDLAVAKLAAGRPKDLDFVAALLASSHLRADEVLARCEELDAAVHPGARGDIRRRLAAMTPPADR